MRFSENFRENFSRLTVVRQVTSLISTFLVALTLLLSSLSLAAEQRAWKSSDGTQTLQATFLSRDETSVTLRRSDNRVLTFAISKLHRDDQSYLEKNHPYKAPDGKEAEPEGDAFGPLRFGDTRKEVEAKLLESSIVKTAVNDDLFGRTGLNGVFETTQTIGGLPCFLYFDWSGSGGLQEVTLRTKALSGESYDGKLRATWTELISLLGKLYGKTLSDAPYPERKELQDGLMLSSHLWRTSDGYSVLLGAGQELSEYCVSVRFTTKHINPIVIP